MPKVVVTEVEELVKWEEGFRTHGDLFRSQTVSGPSGIAPEDRNCALERFGPAGDGFSGDPRPMASNAVKVFVLDKEFVV